MSGVVHVREKGETLVDLNLADAIELQSHRFCRVTPTSVEGRWRVTDVNKVGVVRLGDRLLHIVPKTPLENIVYMASLGGVQLKLQDKNAGYGAERGVPIALARAFLAAVDQSVRRGLIKGYRTARESASVVRGRWDIPRQLAVRPGIPLPIEIEFDDFTEDVDENRILATALSVILGSAGTGILNETDAMRTRAMFAEVTTLPRGASLPSIHFTRLNQHYETSLRLARVILEAVTWTHQSGAQRGGTFLVDMAAVFESFVAHRMRSRLELSGLRLEAQDRNWWLDVGKEVTLRPDLVVYRQASTVTVADTKYKVLGGGTGATPNADVYQAVAYALALGVPDAHLIYVAGDVDEREITVKIAGVTVWAHAVPLAGSPEALERSVDALTRAISPEAITEGAVTPAV